MKLEVGTLNNNDIQTIGEVTKMRLDDNASAMVFRMFTKSVYSDPIGTVIREITSNCFDSHVEAGVDSAQNPVIVKMTKDLSGNYISFIDRGVGMSPDRVLNIYGTYFKSTKRQSNDQIGGFGIGGKTPLAYTSSFYVITVAEKEKEIEYCKTEIGKISAALELTNEYGESLYNNQYGSVEKAKATIDTLTNRLISASNQKEEKIEYVYNIFEGNESPCIELLALKPVNAHNGTEVKIPVKEGDVEIFEQKTLRQLYYFENIVFKGFSDSWVTNDYSIVKGKTFLYRGNTYSHHMHVCLGKVAYPIDWNALGLREYDFQIPVAIRIEIGELVGSGVTVSRESLDYSEANRKILIKKINAVMDELRELLSKQYGNVKTLNEYYHATEDFGELLFPDGRSLRVGKIITKNEIDFQQFKYKDFKIPTRNEILADFFTIKMYGKKPKKYDSRWDESLDKMSKWDNIFYVNCVGSRRVNIKQSYLRDKYKNFYVIEPVDHQSESHSNTLLRKYGVAREILSGVAGKPNEIEYLIAKEKATDLIHDLYDDLFEIVKNTALSYDEVEVPQDYIDSRKKSRITKDTLKVGIPVKECGSYSGNENIEMKHFLEFSGRIYYGFRDDVETLRSASNIFKILGGKRASAWYVSRRPDEKEAQGTLFIAISMQNEKFMKMLGKKAIHIKYFYETFLSRKVDEIVKRKVASEYTNVWDDVDEMFYNEKIMKHIDSNLYEIASRVNKSITGMAGVDVSGYLDTHKFFEKFNVDLKAIDSNEFELKQDMEYIVAVSKKSVKRLQWINMPWSIDLNNEEHRELVNIIQLLIEK